MADVKAVASDGVKAVAEDVVKALRDGPVHAAVMKALSRGATAVEVGSEYAARLYVSVMSEELDKLGIWITCRTETQTTRLFGSSTGYDSDGELSVIRTTTIYLAPAPKIIPGT